MPRLRSVADVTLRESTGGGQDRLELVEAVDHDCERRHQLTALLSHVFRKEGADLWRDLKQPVVENLRGLVGNRGDFGKARLHDRHLLGSHLGLHCSKNAAHAMQSPRAPSRLRHRTDTQLVWANSIGTDPHGTAPRAALRRAYRPLRPHCRVSAIGPRAQCPRRRQFQSLCQFSPARKLFRFQSLSQFD
jgi:hypothetical protein